LYTRRCTHHVSGRPNHGSTGPAARNEFIEIGYHAGVDDIRLSLDHSTPASRARRLAERALHGWNLSDRADDVLLVTTELVQNVTQHTDDGGELHVVLRDDSILIEVTDTNPRMPRVQQPASGRTGGRGMLLVAAVARSWGSRPASWAGRKGKTVWAEISKRLPHSSV
jgi:two-component sensor histidine kinase